MDRVLLGKIATAHGVKGFVKLHVYTEDAKRLEQCGPAYTSETGDKTVSLKVKNSMGDFYLAEVVGVADRNQAEALRHTELWYDRSKLPETDEGEYYYHDLMDLEVIDEAGISYGRIIAVENFGASDLIEVKPKNQAAFYIPFTDDTVIDVTETQVIMSIPAGLLELNASNDKPDDGADDHQAENKGA
jgi:16S rRNA processing protein RimM